MFSITSMLSYNHHIIIISSSYHFILSSSYHHHMIIISSSYRHHIVIISSSYHHHIIIKSSPYHHHLIIYRYPYINIIWFCMHWLAMSNSCYNPFIYLLLNVSIHHDDQMIVTANYFCRTNSKRSCG